MLSKAANGAVRGLAGPNRGSGAHRGSPDVQEKADTGGARCEKASHGYDSRMTQRKKVDRLTAEMEELFADLWYHRLAPQRAGFRPRVDVFRTAEPPTIHVVAELPGIDPEHVDVAVNDGVRIVSGRRQRPHDCGRKYEHIEIDYGTFERRIVLGDGFDAEAAEATYENGLLTIALPVRQRTSGPVRVQVRGGEPE